MRVYLQALLLVGVCLAEPPRKSYYEVLGLSPASSDREVKRAYRSLATRFHPDKMVLATDEDRLDAQNRFIIIAEAYEILSDPKLKRKRYDYILQNGDLTYDPARDWSYIDQKLGIKPMHHRSASSQPEKKGSRSWTYEEASRMFESTGSEDEELPPVGDDMPLTYQALLLLALLSLGAAPFALPMLIKSFNSAGRTYSKKETIKPPQHLKEDMEERQVEEAKIRQSTASKPNRAHKSRAVATIPDDDPVILRMRWAAGVSMKEVIDILRTHSANDWEVAACIGFINAYLQFALADASDNCPLLDLMEVLYFVMDTVKLRWRLTGSPLYQLPSDEISCPFILSPGELMSFLTPLNETELDIPQDAVIDIERAINNLIDQHDKHRASCKVVGNRCSCCFVPRASYRQLCDRVSAVLMDLLSIMDERIEVLEQFLSLCRGDVRSSQRVLVSCITLGDMLTSDVGKDRLSDHLLQESMSNELSYLSFCASNSAVVSTLYRLGCDSDGRQTDVTISDNETIVKEMNFLFELNEYYLMRQSESCLSATNGELWDLSALIFGQSSSGDAPGPPSDKTTLFHSFHLPSFVMLNNVISQRVEESFHRFKAGQVLLFGQLEPSKDFRALEKTLLSRFGNCN